MPRLTLNALIWMSSLTCAALFLALAHLTLAPHAAPGSLMVFDRFSTLIFGMFSAIFSLLGLSFSLNTAPGRPLTVATAVASLGLLGLALVLLHAGTAHGIAGAPAVAAAWLMLLRAAGIAVLPPRGDCSGLGAAACSLALAGVAGGAVAVLRGPGEAAVAFTAALLLSWPQLIDGINAFADKVFHDAARASGARDLAPDAFTRVARAADILIDKAAVMSGPDLLVTNVMAFNNEPKTLLAVAASADTRAADPVAHALRQLAHQWQVDVRAPDRCEPAPGLGVIALLGGQTVVIGTPDLLRKLSIDSFTADAIARSLEADGKTVLRVAVGGRVVGVLGLEGTLRQDAGVAGMALRQEGLTPWLHCADSRKTSEALAGMLGLDLGDDLRCGETALQAAMRRFPSSAPLVLTLSPDRMSLELRDGTAQESVPPLAVSDTDDIGAFPALKALAMRRNLLAVRARRLLGGLWTFAGVCGALALLPLEAAPVLLAICLAILIAFARCSVPKRTAAPG